MNEENSFNGTGMENATALSIRRGPPDDVKMISLSLKAILIFPTIFGNTLVFRAFYKFPSLRTASNIILVSLSVADTLTVFPFILHMSFIAHRLTLVKSGSSTSIQWLCKSSAWLSLVLASVIILHLALISVERVIAVKYPLRYHTIVTNRRVVIASIAVWLWAVAATLVFPQALRANSSGNAYEKLYRAFHPCIRDQERPRRRHGQRVPSSARDSYQIFMVISLLAIPILIILSSYLYVFVVARKHRKQIREQHSTHGVSTWRSELKGAYTLGIVVGVCLSSFVPLLVVTSCRVFGSRHVVRSLSWPLKFIVYDLALGLNACLNPLIYAWRHEKFKNAFRELLRCA